LSSRNPSQEAGRFVFSWSLFLETRENLPSLHLPGSKISRPFYRGDDVPRGRQDDGQGGLWAGQQISDSLVDIVRRLNVR
jgi:hypothetical protein